jgi:hypothetical protein
MFFNYKFSELEKIISNSLFCFLFKMVKYIVKIFLGVKIYESVVVKIGYKKIQILEFEQ